MEAGAGELIPRVTRRCLTEDLEFPPESVGWTIDEDVPSAVEFCDGGPGLTVRP